MAAKKRLPLEGIRVADFCRIQAGPLATAWLGAMGAEVIRIESRAAHDTLRVSQTQRSASSGVEYNKSATWMSLNYSKKSCNLNLRHPRAVELAKEIIKKCDIVTENYATGVMDRLGLDYESLRKIKPNIIMISTSGPGRTGPEKDYVAYAFTIHAYSGLAHISGHPGRNPYALGVMWSDSLAPLTAAYAVLAALYHRDQTGQGQHLDVSMTEATTALIPEAILDYTMNGRVRGTLGNGHECFAPYGLYRCLGEDKWLAIGVENEAQWKALRRALGHPAWAKDPKFADEFSRWQHRAELDALITTWTKGRTPQEATALLQKAGVPAGPSNNVADLDTDPQLDARNFFVPMEHAAMGKGRLARIPWKTGAKPQGQYTPPPLMGEHNEYVFCDLLGMTREEMETLIKQQVIN
ncbi:MAG: CoA transferase [Chloroflexi bacterium]|nr:CoA transferase [Chloroflexota bacterium]